MKKKIYVGCALADVPENDKERFFNEVLELKTALRENNFDVLEFVGLGDHSPFDVVKHDISNVEKADLFLAICTHPSLGLGCEIGHAASIQKKVIAAAPKDKKVSKMVQGYQAINPNHTFIRFETKKEILEAVCLLFKNEL